MEEIRYDADGNPLTANFADYAIISVTEVPSFELHEIETPTPRNPSGPRASASRAPSAQRRPCRTRWSTPTAHLGIRHVDMPLTPQRIWAALAALPQPTG